MKVAVVGGGSTYTPELVDGFIRLANRFKLDELSLIDPDSYRLGLVAGMARRQFARAGQKTKVTATSKLAQGVDGAGVVLLQLRVGGQAIRHLDETVPHQCGCLGQETTGAGGLAKALRTVPLVRTIGAETARLAPNAWIIDFTNPVGIATRALLRDGRKAVGLCNVGIGLKRKIARLIDAPPEHVRLEHVGLNHLTWETGIELGGKAVLNQLLADHLALIAGDLAMPPDLIAALGAIPSYYLRYFYCHDQVLDEQLKAGQATRAAAVAQVERELLELYANPAVDTKPEALSRRGGAFYSDAAIDLIEALTVEAGPDQFVNVMNNGTLPFLPDDHVIEVTCQVSPTGIVPSVKPDVSTPGARGLMAHVAEYERLALDAAVEGSRQKVTQALLAHPLIGQYDKAVKLTDLLLKANREFLSWAK